MDSILKLKSEFDSLVAKIKIPGAEVSSMCKLETWRRQAQMMLDKIIIYLLEFLFIFGDF